MIRLTADGPTTRVQFEPLGRGPGWTADLNLILYEEPDPELPAVKNVGDSVHIPAAGQPVDGEDVVGWRLGTWSGRAGRTAYPNDRTDVSIRLEYLVGIEYLTAKKLAGWRIAECLPIRKTAPRVPLTLLVAVDANGLPLAAVVCCVESGAGAQP